MIGSSPRLWGTPYQWGTLFCRFIPTPVGNTSEIPEICFDCTVHPHACGEHSSLNLLIFFLIQNPICCTNKLELSITSKIETNFKRFTAFFCLFSSQKRNQLQPIYLYWNSPVFSKR